MNFDGASVVLTTAPDSETARRLARRLVEARLVACVNVVDAVRSIYRWQGEVEESEEVLMVMKTATERIPELVREIERFHPYDVPEVVAMKVSAASAPYLAWVIGETGSST